MPNIENRKATRWEMVNDTYAYAWIEEEYVELRVFFGQEKRLFRVPNTKVADFSINVSQKRTYAQLRHLEQLYRL